MLGSSYFPLILSISIREFIPIIRCTFIPSLTTGPFIFLFIEVWKVHFFSFHFLTLRTTVSFISRTWLCRHLVSMFGVHSRHLFFFIFGAHFRQLTWVTLFCFYFISQYEGNSFLYERCSKTVFLILYFRWGEGSPLPFWGPSQSFGFSHFPLLVSGDLRSLSTNICLSPLWPTFFLNGHFFDGLILSIQIRGVVIVLPLCLRSYHETLSALLLYALSGQTPFNLKLILQPRHGRCVFIFCSYIFPISQ